MISYTQESILKIYDGFMGKCRNLIIDRDKIILRFSINKNIIF